MTNYVDYSARWNLKSSLLLGGVFLLLCLTKVFNPTLSNISAGIFITPPKILSKVAFGFSESVADSLWMRSLQDLDYCNEKLAAKRCKGESWLYHVYDVASDLSPRFRSLYSMGSLALSILVSDVEGGEKLLDKGIQNFPDDWILLYRASYHAIYETGNKKKAAELLARAGRAGAPPWVYSLAGRIYSEEGAVELAEKLLIEMKESKQDEVIIQRLEAKIASIKDSKRH